MELTSNLKKEVEATATKDEAREAIRNAGMILDDTELDQVAGGNDLTIDVHSRKKRGLSGFIVLSDEEEH